ncbi:MAG: tRNA dihydrouridine synthase DusB [Flavobacteriales bacterium]|jgi:tRNA-dihydrouridine synthase B|nr:tRNA dihydrouridine synthase DusB [Flavobacteriales bacterium]MBT5933460.1 tRNA dihydrouridine synthase DusB [Flavobacteriales bacterium]MDA7761927.1 tRNA dihydrouridine synthase DusB [Crocinitomicaceae bacterium]MDC0460183.1 tRNA dihydrouridine synthase DusB [Crocinitomicaceae bacterium]MDO7610416.1 tRNA dihydrouridine synthase DusB [Crocinitomicaceae bacterium]
MVKIRNIELGDFPLLLAPMEDVSDPPFRELCKRFGADLMYTEFISSEGLIRDALKSRQKLDIYEKERPIGIQIFGSDIESMKRATEITEQSNPDIIDINYGCPVKKVACKGAGAGILQDIPKMVKMTAEIVKSTKLPVTVKTRLGWDENTKYIVDVAERLQDVGIEAISIHGRTRKQMYKGNADWSLIAAVKNNPRLNIPVFGNGDIDSPEKAVEYKNKYGVDGVMIGRASIGNPWIFREIKHYIKHNTHHKRPSFQEKVEAVQEHLASSIKWKGTKLGVAEMKRHYSNYFKGISNFKDIKMQLVISNDIEELNEILNGLHQNSENFEFVLS